MLREGFEKWNLEKIYWSCRTDNLAALSFFDKHGFNKLDGDVPEKYIGSLSGDPREFVWYTVLRGDDYDSMALRRGYIADCKVLRVHTIPTIEAGELSFFEANKDIPFEVKRIYYITKVPEGVRRGYHAHRKLKQVLFCPYGEILIILDNGQKREEIVLNDPSVGILIEKPTWREMVWLKKIRFW